MNQELIEAIARIVSYNFYDEQDDYNHAPEEGNSQENHIFLDLVKVRDWLAGMGYPHSDGKWTNLPHEKKED